MAREIQDCSLVLDGPHHVVEAELGDMAQWLKKNTPDSNNMLLLAFTLDGLIWGQLANGILNTSHDVAPDYSPSLDKDILQEVRLFSQSAELHLWQCDDGWRYTVIQDNKQETGRHYIEEKQMLWGDQVKSRYGNFSLMQDGVQGLHHVVPCDVPDPQAAQAVKARDGKPTKQYRKRPLHLAIRHYLADEPFARIEFSRLVSLCIDSKDCSKEQELQS